MKVYIIFETDVDDDYYYSIINKPLLDEVYLSKEGAEKGIQELIESRTKVFQDKYPESKNGNVYLGNLKNNVYVIHGTSRKYPLFTIEEGELKP